MMRQPMDMPGSFPEEVRVAVVAADPLARAGLASLLAQEPDLRLVANVDLTDESEALLARVPDVLLIDLGWDIEDELAVLQAWQELQVPLVLLMGADRDPQPLWSLGVSGLLRRSGPTRLLAHGLRVAAAGLHAYDPAFSPPRISPPPDHGSFEALTPRELEVLQLLAEGSSNRAIAHELSISEHTVKFHVTAILAKLGAESRTEAAMTAARAGLILL